MPESPLLLSIERHIARITLNNPETHNALGREEIELFRSLLTRAQADPQVRVLLLDARGERTFCAGASLKQLQAGDLSGDMFNTLTEQLAALRIPSVCALNGNVFGGGAEIALCCDYRIGVSGSRMLVPAARIGLCYPPGGLRRYVDKLGLSAAKRILVASEELTADSMLVIGFLHRVVEREALERESLAFAAHLAGLAPLAVQAMKELLGSIAGGNLDPALAERHVRNCALSADLQEGLAAQRERRAARFQGN